MNHNNSALASLCSDPVGPGQIISAGIKRKPGFAPVRTRFKISEFINKATHSVSYRVSGTNRSGKQIRENFSKADAAQSRLLELEREYLGGAHVAELKLTTLTAEQVKVAELAVGHLGDKWIHLLTASEQFKRNGPDANPESKLLDVAVDEYLAWLQTNPFRPATVRHWRIRMRVFKLGMPNVPVANVTPELIEGFLARRAVGLVAKDTDRRAISRFFSWCKERPRHWITANPCADLARTLPKREQPPAILTVDQCAALLHAAETARAGELVPYIALCLFAGLRPFEAARLTRKQVNLADREIRLEDWQSKTGGRVVDINPTLHRWLRRYPGPIFPKNWRKRFAAVRARAGLTQWPVDVLRHTAISHHFRKHKSYGLTAEQHGNSERIIKKEYQSRVTTAEMQRFYALKPVSRR